MESRDILRQFEVVLSEQVLQDVMTPGKAFQKEIWVPENVQNEAEKQSCILLNKTSDTLLKLLVTVYKGETTEAGVQEQTSTTTQQTQSGDHASDAASEPNGDIAAETGRQSPIMCDSSMQTEHGQVVESGMQTDEKELTTVVVQTDTPSLEELAIQTDSAVLADTDAQTDELEMYEQETQVDLEMAETTTQTDIKQLVENVCQTDIKELTETVSQTDIKEFVENVSQTDIKELVVNVSQTDISVGLREEAECQASVDVTSSETQITIAVENSDCQTEIEVGEQECQTEIDVSDGVSQTEIELGDSESQTDIAELADGVMQTEVWQGSDKATQNVAEMQLNIVQTDQSMSLQEEGCTQVDLQQEHRYIQTDETTEPATSGPAGDADGLPLSQGSTSSTGSNVESSQDCDIPDAGPDQSQEEGVAASAEKSAEVPPSKDTQDDSCQTDPVTIIIGDASFLMQKIRSSAISPTKVSGSGNEIEIEVQADEGYQADDKENSTGPSHRATPSPRRAPPRRGHPRGGPATRGGGRGARTLPPRLPASSLPPAPTTPRPPPPMVIQPQHEPQPQERKYRGPQPAAGGRGKYSCPFCTITFHESPSLYEHLQEEHHSDTLSKHSKPKGREGKTIVPRMPTPAIPGEAAMPVLVPVVQSRSGVQQYVVQSAQEVDEGLEEEQEVVVVQQPEEPGLFEEPMEPVVKKMLKRVYDGETEDAGHTQPSVSRGSPRKGVRVVRPVVPEPEDEDEDEIEAEEEAPPRLKSVKRKRTSSAGVSPRRKKAEVVIEPEEEEEEEEEPEPVTVRGRSTRKGVESRAKAQEVEEEEEEVVERKTRSHAGARGRGGRRGRRS